MLRGSYGIRIQCETESQMDSERSIDSNREPKRIKLQRKCPPPHTKDAFGTLIESKALSTGKDLKLLN